MSIDKLNTMSTPQMQAVSTLLQEIEDVIFDKLGLVCPGDPSLDIVCPGGVIEEGEDDSEAAPDSAYVDTVAVITSIVDHWQLKLRARYLANHEATCRKRRAA